MTTMENTNRRLAWHGMLLFLLGLLTGLAEQRFANVKMGLAAHLEGLMNGIFLLALGAVWAMVTLPSVPKAIAYWTGLYGAYANWAFTAAAAIWGTASFSPINGTAHGAAVWKETIITLGLLSVVVTMISASVLILWGLRRRG
jgi:hydroxylaminobenzene mutase